MRRRSAAITAAAAALCPGLLASASAAASAHPARAARAATAVRAAASPSAGTWGTAREVPGTAALNQGGGAEVESVSCASAGNCSAGGYYSDSRGHGQAFVVGETNGTWGTAQELPGTAALNQGGNAALLSVSCGSAGNCGGGGFYTDSSGHQQAFVASETNGA